MVNLATKLINNGQGIVLDDFISGIIRIRDDGNGEYIETWNHPTVAAPTPTELIAINNIVIV